MHRGHREYENILKYKRNSAAPCAFPGVSVVKDSKRLHSFYLSVTKIVQLGMKP